MRLLRGLRLAGNSIVGGSSIFVACVGVSRSSEDEKAAVLAGRLRKTARGYVDILAANTGRCSSHPCFEQAKLNPEKAEIRIIELLPGDEADKIQCRLQVKDLDDTSASDYEALSYAWETSIRSKIIWVEHFRYAITPNLYNALICLRRTDSTRKLWIDATCIDQKDKGEKGYQVSLMSRIYAEASRVVVWLGRDQEPSDKRPHALLEIQSGATGPDRSRRAIELAKLILKDSNTAMAKDPQEWVLLACLLSRSYFTRLWPVQEVLVAPDLIAQVGHTEVDLNLLFRAAATIADIAKREHAPDKFELHRFMLAANIAQVMLLGELKSSYHRFRPDLIEMISGTFLMDCYELRDRFLVPLSLSSDKHSLKIPSDYRMSEADFVKNLVRSHISTSGRLDILLLGPNGKNGPLPSWCPASSRIFGQITKNEYNASGNTSACMNVSQSPNQLILDGLELGNITACLGEKDHGIKPTRKNVKSQVDTITRKTVSSWLAAINHDPDVSKAREKYGSQAGLDKAFRETFLRDFETNIETVKHYMADISTDPEYVSRIKRRVNAIEDARNESKRRVFDNLVDPERAHKVNSILLWTNASGNLFMLNTGVIGVMEKQWTGDPYEIQEGDKVILLFGSKTPFVLRPHANGFRLVGFAYVHGYMNAEALEEENEGKLQRKQFVLV